MKLGQQVCFSKYWVKNSGFVEPGEDVGYYYNYEKLVPVDVDSKVGIVVGKRNYGTISHLLWDDDRRPNEIGSQWVCISTTTEPFYLVACDLVGFYKVKESDLWEVPE